MDAKSRLCLSGQDIRIKPCVPAVTLEERQLLTFDYVRKQEFSGKTKFLMVEAVNRLHNTIADGKVMPEFPPLVVRQNRTASELYGKLDASSITDTGSRLQEALQNLLPSTTAKNQTKNPQKSPTANVTRTHSGSQF